VVHRALPLVSVSFIIFSLSLISESGPDSTSEPSVARTFARPLKENYQKGYFTRHQNVLDANSKLEAAEKSKSISDKSVYVIVWHAVSYILHG
jgi:hypothetical protein